MVVDKWWIVTKRIDESWTDYDKSVAKAQLHDFGVIYCDKAFGHPIDNEYDQENIHNEEVGGHGIR